ncbi:MAG TPA: hypothetical protein VMT37_01120 [Solirubrobacterales bacterium]|nr:hypothetical protein [Solirubrobacterales bacterium]
MLAHVLAHIAGIPVEETAASLAPIAAATGGIAGLKLRERMRRRSRGRRRPAPAKERR